MVLLTFAPLVFPLLAAPPLSPAQQERVTPVVEVVRARADGVVNIAATHVVTQHTSPFDFFDRPREVTSSSVGSGTVIHARGYVLTNAHVVAQASELSVILADGTKVPAQLVSAVPEEDIAIVRFDPPRNAPITAVPLGRSDDLMVGEDVIAIGNPLGLSHSVTTGIVSALNRALQPSRAVRFDGLIQTDAAINPGNSGGPLLNALGELIGVNTAIRGDAQNVGFAIPVDKVRALLPRLLTVEARGRARLGLTVERDDDSEGAVVSAVAPNTPAARARIEVGSHLVGVGGVDTPGLVEGLVALLEQPPGVPFAMRLRLPEGSVDTVTLVVELPPPPDAKRLAQQRLGLKLLELDGARASRLGLRAGSGVLVEAAEGPAAKVGIKAGDVITRLGDVGLRRLDDAAFLEVAKPGQQIPVRVLRLGRGVVFQAEAVLVAR